MKYRSGLEKKFAKWLKSKRIQFQYESLKLKYMHSVFRGLCQDCQSTKVAIPKIYTPDFTLNNGVIIELKGKFTSQMRTKMLEVIRDNPDLDIRMVFSKDNWLTKSHKMRYSGWCKKNRIKFHVMKDHRKPSIPISWTK